VSRPVTFVAFLVLIGASAMAQARIVEDGIRVPVKILNSRAEQVERHIYVSLFHESAAPKPYPVAVLNHGRSGNAEERAAHSRSGLQGAINFAGGGGGGPKFPPEWFKAFKASGGNGEFVMFPPVSDNGHLTFSRGTRLWEPRVAEFLASLGYAPLTRPRK